jgi:hypothetical protein
MAGRLHQLGDPVPSVGANDDVHPFDGGRFCGRELAEASAATMTAPGWAATARRIIWRDLRSLSAVTTHVFTIHTSAGSPGSAGS